MTTYSYAQLEQLWIQAGGPAAVAPVAAAVALAESSGRSDNNNYNDGNGQGGTQTSWGLWQISNGTHSEPVPNIDDPLVNAQAAVAKWKAAGGTFSKDWGTFTSGAYQHYLQGGVAPSTGTLPAGGGSGSSGDGTATLASYNPVSSVTDAISAAGTLLHDTAVPINWFLEFWEPGQGARLGAAAGAVVSGVAAFHAWQSSSGGGGAAFPMAVGLTGLSFALAYMAWRPWPQQHGLPLKSGAYAAGILSANPPPPGPPPASHVTEIEAGITAIFGLWAASKIYSGAAAIGQAVGGAAGVLGSIWAWLKGLGSAGAGAAGEGGTVPEVPVIP